MLNDCTISDILANNKEVVNTGISALATEFRVNDKEDEFIMADSNIPKRALASAFRELMEEVPFDKIQVAHICDRCDMNRKSFYYHFKDKYDLLNWIFDTDIITYFHNFSGKEQLEQRVEIIHEVCNYLYKNRNFYRKALKVEGQNSLSEHFREYLMPLLKLRLSYLIGDTAEDEFTLNFFADAIICVIERWLQQKDCMPPEQVVDKVLTIIYRYAEAIQKEMV